MGDGGLEGETHHQWWNIGWKYLLLKGVRVSGLYKIPSLITFDSMRNLMLYQMFFLLLFLFIFILLFWLTIKLISYYKPTMWYSALFFIFYKKGYSKMDLHRNIRMCVYIYLFMFSLSYVCKKHCKMLFKVSMIHYLYVFVVHCSFFSLSSALWCGFPLFLFCWNYVLLLFRFCDVLLL